MAKDVAKMKRVRKLGFWHSLPCALLFISICPYFSIAAPTWPYLIQCGLPARTFYTFKVRGGSSSQIDTQFGMACRTKLQSIGDQTLEDNLCKAYVMYVANKCKALNVELDYSQLEQLYATFWESSGVTELQMCTTLSLELLGGQQVDSATCHSICGSENPMQGICYATSFIQMYYSDGLPTIEGNSPNQEQRYTGAADNPTVEGNEPGKETDDIKEESRLLGNTDLDGYTHQRIKMPIGSQLPGNPQSGVSHRTESNQPPLFNKPWSYQPVDIIKQGGNAQPEGNLPPGGDYKVSNNPQGADSQQPGGNQVPGSYQQSRSYPQAGGFSQSVAYPKLESDLKTVGSQQLVGNSQAGGNLIPGDSQQPVGNSRAGGNLIPGDSQQPIGNSPAGGNLIPGDSQQPKGISQAGGTLIPGDSQQPKGISQAGGNLIPVDSQQPTGNSQAGGNLIPGDGQQPVGNSRAGGNLIPGDSQQPIGNSQAGGNLIPGDGQQPIGNSQAGGNLTPGDSQQPIGNSQAGSNLIPGDGQQPVGNSQAGGNLIPGDGQQPVENSQAGGNLIPGDGQQPTGNSQVGGDLKPGDSQQPIGNSQAEGNLTPVDKQQPIGNSQAGGNLIPGDSQQPIGISQAGGDLTPGDGQQPVGNSQVGDNLTPGDGQQLEGNLQVEGNLLQEQSASEMPISSNIETTGGDLKPDSGRVVDGQLTGNNEERGNSADDTVFANMENELEDFGNSYYPRKENVQYDGSSFGNINKEEENDVQIVDQKLEKPNQEVEQGSKQLNEGKQFGKAQQAVYNLQDDSASSHFLAYSLTAIILIMATYILYHNKQKIIAIIIEGKNSGHRRRGGPSYQKLDKNVSEAMPTLQQESSKAYAF